MKIAASLKLLIPSLALAFGMASCESRADKDAKPDAAAPIIENTQARFANDSYSTQRLDDILMDTRTATLRRLTDQHVAVTLDRRLGDHDRGFFDTPLQAIYAPAGKDSGTIMLWDDGTGSRFWSTASRRNDDALDKFVGYIDDYWGGKLPDETIYAGQYGKGRVIRWHKADNFDQDVVRETQALRTPVVKP